MEMFDHVTEIFSYNQKGFMFDESMRQEREYQEQDMRVKQFVLYREDVRDMMELTAGKMDAYILPIIFMIGCCILMLAEGVVKEDLPWLTWLELITLGQAFLYLFMAVWFAVHASVTAHSFAVRLLTQIVRLPVPDKGQIDAARTYAEEFEGMGLTSMLKLPVFGTRMQLGNAPSPDTLEPQHLGLGNASYNPPRAGRPSSMRSFTASQAPPSGGSLRAPATPSMVGTGGAGASSAPGPRPGGDDQPLVAALRHIVLYRELQEHWQAHDAYARVCMALGTYAFVQAAGYYLIGLFIVENPCLASALGSAVLCSFTTWLLIRMDVDMSTWTLAFCAAFVTMAGPLLTTFSAAMHRYEVASGDVFDKFLIPTIFGCNILLIAFIVLIAYGEQPSGKVTLPSRFRNVLFLDVFGWVEDAQQEARKSKRVADTRVGTSTLPKGVLTGLCKECVEDANKIRIELETWESEKNRPNIRSMKSLTSQLASLRDMFNAEAEVIRAAPAVPGGPVPPEARGFWLRIVWSSKSTSKEYFINTDTGATHFQVPPGVPVSDIGNIGEQVTQLHHRVEGLIQAFDLQPKEEEQPTDRRSKRRHRRDQPTGQPAGDAPLNMQALRALDSFSSRQAPESAQALEDGDWRGEASGVLDHDGEEDAGAHPLQDQGLRRAPTQELRFGGAQALSDAPTDFRLESTFSPGQPRVARRRRGAHGETVSENRPPGEEPWRSFVGVSFLLMFLWAVGLVYFIFSPDGSLEPGRPHEEPEVLQELSGLRFWSAPRPTRDAPLQAKGLACHSALGKRGFLVEQYGVSEIDLSSQEVLLSPSPSVAKCLARAPSFHSAGLEGMHVECVETSAGARCSGVLLGRGRALRCPLGHAPGQAAEGLTLDVSPSGRHLHAWEGPAEQLTKLGAWSLPATGRWAAACATSSELFLLGSGKAGQELWVADAPWQSRGRPEEVAAISS